MPEWLIVSYRTLVALVVLFFMTKLLGKRQVSQLSLFEYITGITIGSIAAYIPLESEGTWYLGAISLIVWVVASLGIEYVQMYSKKARDFMDGKATVVIKDGKVLENNLKKERLTSDELMEQLRGKNIFKLSDVEFAIMEPSGELNVLPMKESQPLTPSSLGIKVAPEQSPQIVIMDGEILDTPLSELGLSREWLYTEMDKLELTTSSIFLAQVDSYGQLYVDLYSDDLIVPQPEERAMLLSTLKKCEADLEMFALSTRQKKGKQLYEQCANQLQQVIQEIRPLLGR
ncbi:hypothetical protein D3C74_88460 [compost metagenome]